MQAAGYRHTSRSVGFHRTSGSSLFHSCLQVAAWAAAIAAYIRTLDTNHMISTGEVGYDIQPGQNSSQCSPCASPEPSINDTLARLDVPNPFSVYHNFINCKSGALLSITA